MALSLHDIIKASFDISGIDDEMQKEILNFNINMLTNLEGNYTACMHLLESISQYLRMMP